MSHILCRKERIESFRYHIRRHPASTIRNSNHDVLTGGNLDLTCRIAFVEMDVCGFKRELATFWHRIPCVDRQIDDGDFELIGVDIGAPQSSAEYGFNCDLLAQCSPKQIRQSPDKPGDIDRLRSQGGLARESKEPLRQRFGAA